MPGAEPVACPLGSRVRFEPSPFNACGEGRPGPGKSQSHYFWKIWLAIPPSFEQDNGILGTTRDFSNFTRSIPT